MEGKACKLLIPSWGNVYNPKDVKISLDHRGRRHQQPSLPAFPLARSAFHVLAMFCFLLIALLQIFTSQPTTTSCFFSASKALQCILLFVTSITTIHQRHSVESLTLSCSQIIMSCVYSISNHTSGPFGANLSLVISHIIAWWEGKEREPWQNFVGSRIWFHPIYKLIS